jgi:hypothetical protein
MQAEAPVRRGFRLFGPEEDDGGHGTTSCHGRNGLQMIGRARYILRR